ncbi:unnamed protein product [Rotaria sp. Silwood2]|nr:unnamed protein product [Rotaria sp. Silwood2]CAF4542493.1 unnamed protein product [Rotaria sp. Silwood2]
MHFYVLTNISVLICLSYVYSQILYECNFDNTTLEEHCFTTDVLILSDFALLDNQPLNGPSSDVTSISKPTNDGRVCNLPYNVRNYTWDMYFCYKGYCPTAISANSKCVSGQYVRIQLSDNKIQSFQLKTEPNGINGINEQYLIYYYYMPIIGEKSITIRKEEAGSRNETIDYVTSSPFNGWIKRGILFNATIPGYKLYFDVQKTSSESSVIDIGLDEISIRQCSLGDQHMTTDTLTTTATDTLAAITTDTLTTITTPITDIDSSSSVQMMHTSMLIGPDMSTTEKLEIVETETLSLTAFSSNQFLYECNFDDASVIDNCFTPGTVALSHVADPTTISPSGPLSDVTSSCKKIYISAFLLEVLNIHVYLVKPTNNGELCKLPYRIGSNNWGMYFCNKGYCPTENSLNSTCKSGKFASISLLNNDKKSFQLKTASGGISGIGQQCLIYYYYLGSATENIITIIKNETNGLTDSIDSVSSSLLNGWIRREVSFNAVASGYKIYFEVQRRSGVQGPYVGFDEISIRQGSCDDTPVINDSTMTKTSDVSSSFDSVFITTEETTIKTTTTVTTLPRTISTAITAAPITGATIPTTISTISTIIAAATIPTIITTTISTVELSVTTALTVPTTTLADNVAAPNKKTIIIILATVIPVASIGWAILIIWLKKTTFKPHHRRSKKRKRVSKTFLEMNRVLPA